MTRRRSLVLAGVLLAALPRGSLAQEDPWQSLRPLPHPRRLLAAATDGNLIYTFGGCGSPCFQPPLHTSTFEETLVEVYDPASDSWSARAPMPTILFGAAVAAADNGRIYVVGGNLTGNLTQEYDPSTDTWTLKAPMPTPRHGLAAVAHDGKVYAIGGSGPTGAVEVYDPGLDSWTSLAPLNMPRVFLAAAVVAGRIYAVGGSPDCCGGSATAAVEVYDPANGWSAVAPLPVALQVSAVAALDGKLFVFGGFVPGQGVQGGTFEYDPATGAWTAAESMDPARDQAPAVALGRCAHVLGGSVACHCQALGRHDRFCSSSLPPPADLAVTKSDGVARVCPGEQVTYTIRVENLGPAAVRGARVRDAFPPALTGVSWSCTEGSGGQCGTSAETGPIDDLVDLPVAGSVTYTVTGTVDPGMCGGAFVNTAVVEPPTDVPDPVLANNRATDTDTLKRPDLRIRKGNGVDELAAGQAVTYTLVVENSPDCATPARVRDALPPDFAWTCAPSAGAACTPTGTGAIDDEVYLPAGGSLIYTATGFLSAEAAVSPPLADGDTHCNTARVDAACDTDEDTDCDSVVPCLAELSIAAAPPIVTATSGDLLRYSWVVTNDGTSRVEGAVVEAEPPPVFVGDPAWTCAPAGACSPSSGVGEIASRVTLEPGESATFTVEGFVRQDVFCEFLLAATVAPPPGCRDSDPAGDRATASLAVFPPPPGVRACKTVAGDFREGGQVDYRIVLLNPGPFAQTDNFSSELVDALPEGLELIAAEASAGEIEVEGRTAIWNGAVPVASTVTIDLTARIAAAAGQRPCNRAKVFTDPDGDGVNDDVGASDDPHRSGEADDTCFEVLGPEPEIPTLPTAGLLLLALLLAAAGLARLARGDA